MANSKDNIRKYATSFISFDEPSGNVYDNIGGYVGTLFNNPQRVIGWNGKGNAIQFNGSNQYVQFNNRIINNGIYSIRFKIKISTQPTSASYVIMTTQSDVNTAKGFRITVNNNGYIILTIANGTSHIVSSVKQPTKNICDNQWHDVFIKINTNLAEIYIDDMTNQDSILNLNGILESSVNLFLGGTNNSNFFNGQLDQIEIYKSIISPINDKYLILNNNEYKYHDGTVWKATTDTEENFIQYGMEQLSQITESQWQELSGDVSIVMWSDFEDKQYMNVVLERDPFTAKDVIGDEYDILVLNSEQVNPQQLLLDAVANPQTSYPTGDIPLFGINELKSVNVVASGNGRMAISVDSGVTWNKLSNNTWDAITDIADGMTFAEFNTLTNQQLQVLKGDSNTIRFAYYLTSDTEIDKIEMRVSINGTPEFANKNDYDMSYDATTKTITYDIKKSGHYVVNYANTQ